MPIPAYMTLEGETQGDISEGGCGEDSLGTLSREDQADTIQIQEFKHNIVVPTDPQTGQPVGPRIHEEMIIVKAMDKTTPLLYEALTNGETITTLEIKWYRINSAGETEHYFTTTLERARIVKIRSYMPDIIGVAGDDDPVFATGMNSANEDLPTYNTQNPRVHMEEVTFRYRKIAWVHEICGTEGEDDWDGEE
jgi:type VI secretion system secreted protein Hcp